jgi:hypothetical protein
LTAPGEHYFDAYNANRPFPNYLNGIIHASKNRIIWIFFTEIDWKNQTIRNKYADKVAKMSNIICSKDEIILMCSKADQYVQCYEDGFPLKECFLRKIGEQYPKILNQYKNGSIRGFFSKYQFNFVAFSAGIFNILQNGTLLYSESTDYYPKILWKTILKSIK